jgi:hypothetical protein
MKNVGRCGHGRVELFGLLPRDRGSTSTCIGAPTGGPHPAVGMDQQIIDLCTNCPANMCAPRRFVNRSAYMVQEEFSLARAYALFTSMGVRHLVVVDELNRVCGIITRKDLAPGQLNSAHHRRVTSCSSGGTHV